MPQHPNKQLVNALLRKRDALKAQQAALQETQRELLLELHVGAKLCECLGLLQTSIMQHHQQDSSYSPSDHGVVLSQLAADMLQEQAAGLLRQVPGLQDSDSGEDSGDGDGSAGASALGGLEQLTMAEFEQEEAGVHTVSPPHDPLAYMRHLVSLPVQPGVPSMTAVQFAGLHKDVVTQAGLLLHGLECEAVPERRQQLVEQLQQQWDRYFSACLHCAIINTQMQQFQYSFMINQATMQPDEEAAVQQAASCGQLMRQLGLTQHQLERIAAGVTLCMRQLERIHAEQTQLQALPQEQAHGTSSSSSSVLASMASSSPAAADARRARLAAEQQRAVQLNRLLLKGTWIRLLGSCWVICCLTWEQVTKTSAANWPYLVRWLTAAGAGLV